MKRIFLITTIVATLSIAGLAFAGQPQAEMQALSAADVGLPEAPLTAAIAAYDANASFGSACVPYAVFSSRSCFYEALSACGNLGTYLYEREFFRCCYVCGIPPK